MPPIIGITATLKEDGDAVAERPLGRFVRTDLDYVEGVAGAGAHRWCCRRGMRGLLRR